MIEDLGSLWYGMRWYATLLAVQLTMSGATGLWVGMIVTSMFFYWMAKGVVWAMHAYYPHEVPDE